MSTSAKLNGGMGNQLFQIAATISSAMDNNDDFAFDFDNRVVMQGNTAREYRNVLYADLSELPKNWRPEFVYSEPHIEHQSYEPIPYHKNMLLDGYFQSEKFFKGHKELIINIFSHLLIIDKLKEEFGEFLENSVSVHIRRGDYVKIGESMEQDYYFKALNKLWETEDTQHVLIFSDDIGWCKENFFVHSPMMVFIRETKDYEDLYLQSLCTHNVVGNSSFSWWGAYLNRNPYKKVFMPKPWTTSIGEDIYPEGAIIINR